MREPTRRTSCSPRSTPRPRRLWLPGAGNVVLSDTVGFIRDLPHGLVAAFRATLEETVQADLLLHVVDASSPARDEQIAEVNKVLAEIGAEREHGAADRSLEQDRRRRSPTANRA
jgi:50S ribosomal subunit-associated GTPase HflX